MPRTARAAIGGVIYHVLNRGNGRMGIFRKPPDYQAFVQLLVDAKNKADIELFGFCLMPNHWHLILRPAGDGDLAGYLSWVSNTHVKRYRAHYPHTSGHLYQGRYKSFAVEQDDYLLTLLRYVEANPMRGNAMLAAKAQEWPWSSLGCDRKLGAQLLSAWPVDRPRNWIALVNQQLEPPQQRRITTSMERGRPLGSDAWTRVMAGKMGISYTLNPRGRPKIEVDKG
jgi:putative transposase